MFKVIQEAYEIMTDPTKRKLYEDGLDLQAINVGTFTAARHLSLFIVYLCALVLVGVPRRLSMHHIICCFLDFFPLVYHHHFPSCVCMVQERLEMEKRRAAQGGGENYRLSTPGTTHRRQFNVCSA